MTNTYDKQDRVQRVSVLRAGPLKFGAYRVRDPETDEWSKLQFHLTYDNTVMAALGEDSAIFFSRMVHDTLEKQYPPEDWPAEHLLPPTYQNEIAQRRAMADAKSANDQS